ncbi:MAG: hypothetical protein ACFE0J_03850 [Elainellaceae cyanobacterium]
MPFFVTIQLLVALSFQLPDNHWGGAVSVSLKKPNLSLAQAVQNPPPDLSETSPSSSTTEASDEENPIPGSIEQSELESIQKYNSDLMNTVFFSLLGSVLTVATVMLGFKILVDVIDRENQKQAIVEEAKSDLLDWIDKRLSLLATRTQWLEYQIATLSADQLEQKRGLESLCSVQDRLRAIEALLQTSNVHQEEAVSKCIEFELKNIKETLEDLVSYQQTQPNLQSRIPELAKFNERIREKILHTIDRQSTSASLDKIEVNKDHIEHIRHSLRGIEL